jgi:hypothetical protein
MIRIICSFRVRYAEDIKKGHPIGRKESSKVEARTRLDSTVDLGPTRLPNSTLSCYAFFLPTKYEKIFVASTNSDFIISEESSMKRAQKPLMLRGKHVLTMGAFSKHKPTNAET